MAGTCSSGTPALPDFGLDPNPLLVGGKLRAGLGTGAGCLGNGARYETCLGCWLRSDLRLRTGLWMGNCLWLRSGLLKGDQLLVNRCWRF